MVLDAMTHSAYNAATRGCTAGSYVLLLGTLEAAARPLYLGMAQGVVVQGAHTLWLPGAYCQLV